MSELHIYEPSEEVRKNAAVSGMEGYNALCKEAEDDYEGFWARRAKELIEWKEPFTQVLDESNAPFFKWFADGKLNVSYNCLDRNVNNGLGDKIALIFEGDKGDVTKVTYRELLVQVCKFANALRGMGVKKGDRVVIYLPMSIEGVVAMQACARIGATHSIVFGGFSAHALRDRIEDAAAVALITSDGQHRGGKALPLKPIADEALALGGCDSIKNVIVVKRTGGDCAMNSLDKWYHDVVANQPETCEPEWVDAEHPLFILYTSGSTGKPKGVQHSSGGYLLQAMLSMKYTFDIKPDDIFWCTADIGWVTGHTFITYGPLACGTTEIVFEGVPTFPDAGRFWKMIQDHKVTVFYTAPTAIRLLIKAADANPDAVHPKNYDLSSLRILGSVGEPINPAVWEWYYENIGGSRCPIVDTFWQTETGAHVLTPMPGATPLIPGSCTLPFPGVQIAVVDETGTEVPNGQGGILVIKRPWPSMIRTIWNDPDRFKKSYFPDDFQGKLYLAGDGAIRDEKHGYFTITGRIDDVLNVSGHRMGTMEIESALVAHEKVAEAAVVGRPDDLTGEAVVAFVVLKGERPTGDEAAAVIKELQNWVGQEIGPIAKPKDIRFGENLPKTRSGKIMRRMLRQLAKGEEVTQDTSTLENPAILDQLK